MYRPKPTQFNCFSPPVMLATLIIEFSLAAYTIWRYKMSSITRLVSGMLVFLALFQLAEYHVCTGGAAAAAWSRLGFVAISTLPAFGIHLMHLLADKPNRRAVNVAYASMAGYIIFFMTYHQAFVGHECLGNYVIFHLGTKVGGAYALTYYYPWLLIGITLGWRWANELMKAGKKARARLEAVRGLIIGYLVFIVPTAVTNTLRPSTAQGIPSIMCGFAVILALIMVFYILPRTADLNEQSPRLVSR